MGGISRFRFGDRATNDESPCQFIFAASHTDQPGRHSHRTY
jgi:hypothetical protein